MCRVCQQMCRLLQAKQKQRLRHASPQQSGDVGGHVHDPSGGQCEISTIDIVIDKERTPPTQETRVSPISSSVDPTGE